MITAYGRVDSGTVLTLNNPIRKNLIASIELFKRDSISGTTILDNSGNNNHLKVWGDQGIILDDFNIMTFNANASPQNQQTYITGLDSEVNNNLKPWVPTGVGNAVTPRTRTYVFWMALNAVDSDMNPIASPDIRNHLMRITNGTRTDESIGFEYAITPDPAIIASWKDSDADIYSSILVNTSSGLRDDVMRMYTVIWDAAGSIVRININDASGAQTSGWFRTIFPFSEISDPSNDGVFVINAAQLPTENDLAYSSTPMRMAAFYAYDWALADSDLKVIYEGMEILKKY